MAMSYIWSGLVILSFLWGFFHGNLSAVAAAALEHWDELVSRYAGADTPRTPYFDRLQLEHTRQAHDYLLTHQGSPARAGRKISPVPKLAEDLFQGAVRCAGGQLSARAADGHRCPAFAGERPARGRDRAPRRL